MDKETVMMAHYYLQQYAEILWFRGCNEAEKCNTARAEKLHKEYHEVHNVMDELQKYRATLV
jgi:hypothetical protein